MFPMNLYGLYGQSLADVWLTWVTRGLFIGQRRIMLDTQGMFATIRIWNHETTQRAVPGRVLSRLVCTLPRL